MAPCPDVGTVDVAPLVAASSLSPAANRATSAISGSVSARIFSSSMLLLRATTSPFINVSLLRVAFSRTLASSQTYSSLPGTTLPIESTTKLVECSLEVVIQAAGDHVRLTPDVDTQLSYIILSPFELTRSSHRPTKRVASYAK